MDFRFYKGLFSRLITPFILFLWWRISLILWDKLNCQGRLKGTFSCLYADYDLTFFVGFGLFWAYILWFPVLLISIFVSGRYIKKHLVSNGYEVSHFTYKDLCVLSWKALFFWTVLIMSCMFLYQLIKIL